MAVKRVDVDDGVGDSFVGAAVLDLEGTAAHDEPLVGVWRNAGMGAVDALEEEVKRLGSNVHAVLAVSIAELRKHM